MSTAPLRVALLIGSTRKGSNGLGLASWVTSAFNVRAASHSPQVPIDLVPVDFTATSYTLGPLTDDIVPAGIKSSAGYPSPAIQKWSEFVNSCSGFIVISPQYNWGYPGELKNALDHLFNEWHGKPVSLITYGGRGGGKSGDQLRQVLKGGLDMNVIDVKTEIALPQEYIRTSVRVSPTVTFDAPEGKDSWLQLYSTALTESLDGLLDAVTPPKAQDAPAQ